MIAPVSVGYAQALLRQFGKTVGQRALLLKDIPIEESILWQPSAEVPGCKTGIITTTQPIGVLPCARSTLD